MPQTTIINKFGKILGWNQVKLSLYGRTLEGITELEYKDTVDKEPVMGAGKYPVGMGEGGYKAECSITILAEEYHGMIKSLPANTRIQDIPATDVPVLYQLPNDTTIIKDVVRNVEFTGVTKAVKQGDKMIAMKCELVCTHIDWNQT